jgi:hypothetical protein
MSSGRQPKNPAKDPGAERKVKTHLSVQPSRNNNGLKTLIFMQLAPGWRSGANCDQYPRGDRRLGEACTDRGKHTSGRTSRLSELRHMKSNYGNPSAVACVNDYVVLGPGALRVGLAFGEAQWLTTKLLH